MAAPLGLWKSPFFVAYVCSGLVPTARGAGSAPRVPPGLGSLWNRGWLGQHRPVQAGRRLSLPHLVCAARCRGSCPPPAPTSQLPGASRTPLASWLPPALSPPPRSLLSGPPTSLLWPDSLPLLQESRPGKLGGRSRQPPTRARPPPHEPPLHNPAAGRGGQDRRTTWFKGLDERVSV